MEDISRKFGGDPRYLGVTQMTPRTPHDTILIEISDSDSDDSVQILSPAPQRQRTRAIVISSDEEEDETSSQDDEATPTRPQPTLSDASEVVIRPPIFGKPFEPKPLPEFKKSDYFLPRKPQIKAASNAGPSRPPSNYALPSWSKPGPLQPVVLDESFPKPIDAAQLKRLQLGHASTSGSQRSSTGSVVSSQDESSNLTPEAAEKELRELMGNAMNDDVEVEIEEEDKVVEGFRKGITLLPHQVIGRKWMQGREDISRKACGGILADDMGLGKTIQTLTRIVEGPATDADLDAGYSKTTLVVCPLALVAQWAAEVEKMTKLRVLKHQGTSRTTDPSVLERFDVVVTTYETIQSEFSVWAPPVKDASVASSKSSGTVSKVSKSSKLQLSSDSDSEEEIEQKASVKAKGKKAAVKKDALFNVRWWRVVLDEAHNIKNRVTKRAVACCELQSKFRWCLTGTPMQNNVTELYSLIKFLRIKPFSNWDNFNTQVAKPIQSGRGAATAMKRLHVVLERVMLRRRKDDTVNGKALINLPSKTIEIVSCPFDPYEQHFYDNLEEKMEAVLQGLMAKSDSNKAYISVLLLLLRLRQACNHPLLVSKDYKKDSEAIESTAAKKDGAGDVDGDDLIAAFGQLGVTKKCQLCTTAIDDRTCGEGEWRIYCRPCVALAKKAKEAERDRPTSAKIRAILRLLAQIDEDSDGEEKTIIFSQFTSMLDLVEPFLKEKGIKYTRYDGSMMPKDREKALETIKTSKTTRVILISFKAGSTGLNLTACNHVILVDLWWNPALEDQAFDRAHRYGQTRDVKVYKLKIDKTVEDRILELQMKKRDLATAALSGNKIKGMKLGMEDLLALFRPGAHSAEDD